MNVKKHICILCLLCAASVVQASDYGCKVLLCLSNPQSNGGPLAVAECTDPVLQLYSDLRKGKQFPTCDFSDGNDGHSYARQVYDPYDPCPTPLQPAQASLVVAQGKLKSAAPPQTTADVPGRLRYASDFTLSTSPAMSESPTDTGSGSLRACVGNHIGTYQVASLEDRGYDVSVFDRVTWQAPNNPRAIDIYVDSQFYQRVRY